MFATLQSDGGWVEDDVGILPGGDVGGDAQISGSWFRRYGRALPRESETCLLDFYAYWALDDDPPGWEPGQARPIHMQVMVEHLHCTDPNQPGDTETFSEYLYWDHQEDRAHEEDPNAPRKRVLGLDREDLASAEAQIHCTAGSSTPLF